MNKCYFPFVIVFFPHRFEWFCISWFKSIPIFHQKIKTEVHQGTSKKTQASKSHTEPYVVRSYETHTIPIREKQIPDHRWHTFVFHKIRNKRLCLRLPPKVLVFMSVKTKRISWKLLKSFRTISRNNFNVTRVIPFRFIEKVFIYLTRCLCLAQFSWRNKYGKVGVSHVRSYKFFAPHLDSDDVVDTLNTIESIVYSLTERTKMISINIWTLWVLISRIVLCDVQISSCVEF